MRRLTKPLRTIGIRESITVAVGGIIGTRAQKPTHHKSETGSLSAPHFFALLCRLGSDVDCALFSGDAHRKSGVFSFGSALSPVESCSLQNSMSSRNWNTPAEHGAQAKKWRNAKEQKAIVEDSCDLI
jgi:hypothetical protein